ncbi:MAG TPA: ABC transporter ATP-binding protein [Acidimicrobiales bacterium]|nr:ABC transporter ATP-binding protein [Acidimicrobiales bacterium]
MFDDVHRRFGSSLALDGFSLEIAAGEFMALLGPSGCGKTTALRVLAGFELPERGRVLADGVDLAATPAQHRDMGMVFQSYSLFPNMSALDNVAFGLQLRRVRGAQRRRRAGELLELVELSTHAAKYPHQLSGGQQQRVALARAIAIEPRVLLLDEPLSALDARVRADLRDQIRHLQRRLGITTVFVTHDQEEALSMADRVCVMAEGRAQQVATPARLYSEPNSGFVAQFIGVSSRVPATRCQEGVEVLGSVVRVRGATPSHVDLDALVRPEDVAVFVRPDGPGVVTQRSFLGAITRLEVMVGGASVRVDVASSEADEWVDGVRVELKLRTRDVVVAARSR